MVKIAEHDLRSAHRHSLKNRPDLVRGGACGCFYCLKTFDASEVTDWTDDGLTALCPRCGIDAVLSSNVDPINPVFLRHMHDFWFKQSSPVNLMNAMVGIRDPSGAK